LLGRKPAAELANESVGAILHRCVDVTIKHWLMRAKLSNELNHLRLSDADRTGHLAKLVEDVVRRLGKRSVAGSESDVICSDDALNHGKLRYKQGYTPAMLVHESRILQVTIFGTLQKNLNNLDFSLLLPDVMTIESEVDAQLTRTVTSYMDVINPKAA
jgi:hypothetical protein